MKNTMAITMGDPFGIGPEVIVKAIHEEEETGDLMVVGDYPILQRAQERFAPGKPLYSAASVDEVDPSRPGIPVLHCASDVPAGDLSERGPTAEGGRASIRYIRTAVELAMEGRVAAVITAPISKEAIHMGGYPYPGHTEYLAELTNTKRFAMMLAGGSLRVILVTTHCALAAVPHLISKERIYDILEISHEWWVRYLGYPPKLAVAALNPHGGEGGLFGSEEDAHIRPAIDMARSKGMTVSGPHPSDTLFHFAKDGRFDAVVVMYHDQGLIPLKMISFGKGVNCTLGLPIIRTSVDHGTGYDIAWKGWADPSSLHEAIRMARDLVHRRWNAEHGA